MNPNAIKDTPPKAATSTLGGDKAIAERFKAFAAADEAGETTPPDKPEKAATTQKAPEGTETAPDASLKGKGDGVLPPEKPLQKAPESKVEGKGSPDKKDGVQSTEGKTGTDGLTKEDRAELVAFKKKAERVDELEAKVADHEATKKELAELKALRTDLEERLKVNEAKATAFDVRASKHFQESIIKPMDTLTKGMDKFCADNKMDAEAVWAAIQNPNEVQGDEALTEFESTLNARQAEKFNRMINEMRDLDRKGNELLEKAPEAWSAIQAEMEKKAKEDKEKDKESYTIANTTIMKAMEERFPFIKEKNLREEILKETGDWDFDNLNPSQKATLAQSFSVALRINPLIDSYKEEIASLKAALAKHTKSPNPDDGHASVNGAGDKKNDSEEDAMKGMTTGQRMAHFMRSQMGGGG